jgi:opacity protein-like surface antigen
VGLASLANLFILPSVFVCCLCITEIAIPAEFGDVEVSVYALGSWPRDETMFNQGTTVPASIQQGFGAGLKVGLFPATLHRVVGLEIDSNIHSGALSFPNLANGQNNGAGRSDLLLFNTMFNVVVRYPGETVRPYVGIGAGWSTAVLLNPNIAGRDDEDFGSARAFGHQYLGGAQVLLNPKVFLFAEYRYFSSDYHWTGLAVGFRDHNALLGIGLRF